MLTHSDKRFTTLMFHKEMAVAIGQNEAILLSQLRYMLSRYGEMRDGHKGVWLHSSFQELHTRYFSHWSLNQLVDAARSLQDANLIEIVENSRDPWENAQWYTIDNAAYSSLITSMKVVEDGFRPNKEDIDPGVFTIAGMMVEAWNDEFKGSPSIIPADEDPRLSIRLCKAYKSRFHENIDEWREYARKVKSSKFLMGEKDTPYKFKAPFHWLIKEEIIEKVLSGYYGLNTRDLDMQRIPEQIKKHKKEIPDKVLYKLAQHMRGQVNNAVEIENFKQYILGAQYDNDNDKYQLKTYVTNKTWINPYAVLHEQQWEEHFQYLYESYLLKKHIGLSSPEIN
ncbi:hypothetical protein EDM53_05445, partial [Rickettsiales endosymbiont of Peranema trichophorum]|uniref:hypothetical protein n=1 Tax=Rickettsiales endosymbiont of Peranema trichophorum TaxID=2486577 RepID=UPI001023BC15